MTLAARFAIGIILSLGTLAAQETTGSITGVVKDSTGEVYPEKGGFITFWFEIKNEKDSTIDSQFADPNPVGIPTPEATYKPSIEEGFLLLTEGDSAVFLLNSDSLYSKTFHRPIPAGITPGGRSAGMWWLVRAMARLATKQSAPIGCRSCLIISSARFITVLSRIPLRKPT